MCAAEWERRKIGIGKNKEKRKRAARETMFIAGFEGYSIKTAEISAGYLSQSHSSLTVFSTMDL